MRGLLKWDVGEAKAMGASNTDHFISVYCSLVSYSFVNPIELTVNVGLLSLLYKTAQTILEMEIENR